VPRAQLTVSLGDLSTSSIGLNELKSRKKKLIFGKSAIHSWGLYAAEPIEKEDFVVEYLGEYVRAAVADAREKHYRRAGFGDDYIFRVDDDLFIDATRRGGLARFANHCCEPNCYTKTVNVHGKPRIVLYSKERIAQGEEITYDYKFEYEEDRSSAIPCACGTKKCTGYLNWAPHLDTI
jgi:histone-lysine N-methyltransferase SETD1